MKSLVALCIPAMALALQAHAESTLTVVNFGGANGTAQKKAYYEPFEKSAGARIIPVEYNGEQAKIKAMVETGKVTWDVVEAESADLDRGCDEGLYEKLDWGRIGPKSDFIPAAVHDCGIGIFVWSTVLSYDANRLKDPPKSWADFWDVKRFPGKRALRKNARFNLEFALMADGVKPAEVYKTLATKDGVERAFRKLAELRPHLQWWEAGAQPPQFLVAGDVVMASAYNGRIDAAQREGRNLAIAWAGGIYDLDYWAIPKGTPNRDLATRYIAFAVSPNAQAEFARLISYGPTATKALTKLDAKTLAQLPSAPANAKDALKFDFQFWSDHGEAMEKRFNAWVAQ